MSNPSDLPPLVAALPQETASTSSAHGLRPGSPRTFFTAVAAAARRRIVIAVDLSGDSEYAITWAVGNQLRPGDAVVVLHVVSSISGTVISPEAEAEAEAASRRREANVDGFTSEAEEIEGYVDSTTALKLRNLAEPLNHAAEVRHMIHIVKDDNTKSRICDEVRTLNITLLIMGSKGFGSARAGDADGLGSVSDYCVRHCGCPVVVVRPNVVGASDKKALAVYARRKKPAGKGVTVYSRRTSKPKTKNAESSAKLASVVAFKGSIPEALDQAVRDKKLFVVFIAGEDETSRKVESSTLVDEQVIEAITRSCIFVRLNQGHEDEHNFSVEYPHKALPSLSVIGLNGAMLWNHEGYISPGDLKESIEKTWAQLIFEDAKVALIYDVRMMDHMPPNDGLIVYHEVPQRLTSIYEMLEKDGTLKSCRVYTSELATIEELLAVHSQRHIDEMLSITEEVQSEDEKAKSEAILWKKELYCSSGTRRAILLAAGGAVKACSMVAKRMHRTAFALIRPPGHHAGRDHSGGFCFTNNMALAVHSLLNKYKMERVFALDWDIHHGDGTQDIFFADKRVLTFSLHRSAKSYFPNSEKQEDKIGEGSGKGYNFNICWGGPGVKDDDFYYVWKQILMPVIREFSPEIILIACGFDAALNDDVGGCNVTPKGYATLLSQLNDLSVELNIGLVLILEGGYNLVSIGKSASACVKVLSGDSSDIGDINNCQPPRKATLKTVKEIKKNLGPYWSVLRPPGST